MPTKTATPYTDHLWQLGFTVKSQANRLPMPTVIDDEGTVARTEFEITVYPERGEARRLFAGKGPAKSEVKSNLALELFLREQEEGTTTLKDFYTETCSKHMLSMLKAVAPSLTEPKLEEPA